LFYGADLKSVVLNAKGITPQTHLFFWNKKTTEVEKMEHKEYKKYKYLTYSDRKKIAAHCADERAADIATRLGFCTATIYRELKRGITETDANGTAIYDPDYAEHNVRRNINMRGRRRIKGKGAELVE
jgi:hypothetical protein